MHFQLKKLSLLLIGLGLSSNVMAANYISPVTTPDGAYHISFTSFWGQPVNNDWEYATFVRDGAIVDPASIIASSQAVNPNYHFGFRLEGGYSIGDNTDNDFLVNWLHFNNTDNSDIQRGMNDLLFIRWLNPFNGGAEDFNTAHATSKVRVDVVNGELGHTFHLSAVNLRLFGGIQYANLTNDFEISGRPNPAIDFAVASAKFASNANFYGVGPRVGVDMLYPLGYGFGIVAGGATGLVIGTTQTTINGIINEDEDAIPFQNNSARERAVIPTLDGKLALNYSHGFGPDPRCINYILGIEAGWQAIDYINVIKHEAGGIQLGPNAVLRSVPVKSSDLALQGPYAQVTISFA